MRRLLNELFSSPDSPPMVAVLAYRSEDIAASPSLKALPANTGSPINLDQFGRLECRRACRDNAVRILRVRTTSNGCTSNLEAILFSFMRSFAG